MEYVYSSYQKFGDVKAGGHEIEPLRPLASDIVNLSFELLENILNTTRANI